MKESDDNSRSSQKPRSRRLKKRTASRVKPNSASPSENPVTSFLNHLPGFAWMKDLKGRYVYGNSALQTRKEYRDGYIGLTDADLLRQDIADIYRANDQKVIAERKPLETLEPYLVNGEEHFQLVSKFPIFDKSGAIIMIGGSSIDITAQARTEERLREYERAVEGVEEMIAVVDRDYRYLVANEAFLTHRGMPREEVVGRFVWDVLTRETFTQSVKPKLDQAFAGEVVRYEMQHRYPALGLRELSVSYFPIEGANGIDRVTCVLQDITERKAASNALNEAERHYREIFENAGEGIFQTTPGGKYITANPALARMHGFESPDELIRNRNDISRQVYVEPERREEFMRLLEEHETVSGFEEELYRKDGSKIWVSVNARAVRDEQHSLLYYEGAAQDISERKRAEAELRRSEKQYRDLVETAHDLIWAVDAQGTITFMNQASRKIYGYEPEELIGRSYLDLLSPEERSRESDALQKILASGEKFVIGRECEVMDRDGNRHILIANAVTQFDQQGNAIGTMGTSADITERKQAEEALLKLAAIVEFSDDAIIGKTLEGTITSWNKGAEVMYGYLADEVVGREISILFPSERSDELPAILEKIGQGQALNHYETERLRKDGQIIYVSLTVSPIQNGDGKVIGASTIARDITDQKRAEAALRESEKRFRLIAETIVEVFWMADINIQKMTYVSPAYERVWGRSRESLYKVPRSFLDAIHADDRARVLDDLKLKENGQPFDHEYRIIRPDGVVRWIWDRGFPVNDASGKVTHFVGIAQDVTKSKQDEAALRESEERFRDLVENSTELICTHDLDGFVFSANPAACAALGCELDELVGGNVRDILAPGVRHHFDDYLARLRNDGAAAGIMFVQSKSGERRIWEYHNSLRTEGVATPIVRGMARDITEEQQVQKALHESEERYRELFENSRDAIYVHDLTGRYISVNRAAETLSGFTRDEILRRHYSNFVTPKHLKKARESFCIKLDAPIETTYEAEIICKDGKRKAVEVSSRMIYKDAVAVAVQGTARDITERKRAQQALQTYARRLLDAQEAERQNIARELHDQIGQILTAVSLNLHSIQKSCQTGACPPNIDESIQVVEDALSRVRELSLELRPSLLDDLGLAAALRWYVGRYTARSGIATEILGDADIGRISHEVETACFRITQEALTNAARHSHATRATVHIERTNGNLELRVTDNGIGFDFDQLLYGMASALSLGLRGMQERALAVKGRVEITSKPGQGTEVTLNVPVN